MTNAILRGKPDAGNPHVRFDEGEVASAKPRRGSLLYKIVDVLKQYAFCAKRMSVWARTLEAAAGRLGVLMGSVFLSTAVTAGELLGPEGDGWSIWYEEVSSDNLPWLMDMPCAYFSKQSADGPYYRFKTQLGYSSSIVPPDNLPGYKFKQWLVERMLADWGGDPDDYAVCLYAQWEKVSEVRKIHFDVNDEWFSGGLLNANVYPATGTMGDLSYAEGRDVVLPRNQYVREGFEFAGWAKAKNFDAVYQDGATIRANELPTSDSGLVLYAVWKAKTVVITLDYREWHGVSQNIKTKTETTGYGYSLWFPIDWATSDIIGGWYTAPSGGTRVDTGTWWVPTKDTTYYLHWRHKTCTIKYNANGGTGSMPNQSFTMGINQRLSLNQFHYDGHVFNGWAKSSDGAVVYTDGEGVLLPTAIDGGTVTLYAVWTPSAPPNNNFASATVIVGSSGSTTGSNVGATAESGEPLLSYKSGATTTVWWKWTAPSSGRVRFDTIGSSLASGASSDTVMGVYTGSSLSSLTKAVPEDDDGAGSGNASKCEFDCISGTRYYIVVAGYGGKAGTIKLNWILTPGVAPPPADGMYTEFINGLKWTYEIDGGVAILCETSPSGNNRAAIPTNTVGLVTIPSKFGGCTLRRISRHAFWHCEQVTGFGIPDCVRQIDTAAFWECNALERIEIPEGVTHIGFGAFHGCDKLSSAVIPKSVIFLGNGSQGNPFVGCPMLSDLAIRAGNNNYKIVDGMILTCDGKTLVSAPSSRTTIVVPAGVEELARQAISGDAVISLTLPESLSRITDGIGSCRELKRLVIPSSVSELGESAFVCLRNETVVDFKGLPPTAIYDLSQSARLATYPAKYASEWGKVIGADGYWKGLEMVRQGQVSVSFDLGEHGVRTGGGELTQIVEVGDAAVAPNVVAHEGWTFLGWSCGFSRVTGNLTVIARYWSPFEIVDGVLTKYKGSGGAVTIPSGVARIDDRAFFGCRGLTSVTIPSSVMSIGDYAFCDCSSLTSVTITIPSCVTSIGRFAFYGCGLTSVKIPFSVTSIGDYAFVLCNGLMAINVEEGNGVYSSMDGILYDKSKSKLVLCPAGKRGAVSIPSGVTSVEPQAFAYCGLLTSVTIPSSVTIIGEMAFHHCSLLTEIVVEEGNAAYSSLNGILYNKARTELIQCPGGKKGEVTLPSGVERIGDCAFDGCNLVTAVTMPIGVTSIGYSAFYGSGLVSLTLPPGLVSIDKIAFMWCSSLTSMTIPSSVTSIGDYAFHECDSLKTVFVARGDVNRVRTLLEGTDSELDFANIGFVEVDEPTPKSTPEPAPAVEIVEPVQAFVAPTQKAAMSGAVLGADGSVAGIVQLDVGKVSKKNESKVTVTIIGIDGKKMKSKAVPVATSAGLLRVTFNVKGYGPLTLDIGADGFIGEAGGETIASVRNGSAIGGATVAFSLAKGYALNGLLTEYLPNGVKVTRTAKKWTLPKAGKLKYVKPNEKKGIAGGLTATGENISGLKLTYTAKTGVLKGSFKLWTFDEAKKKLKSVSAKVTGVVIDGVGYCEATVKKQKIGDLIVE